MNDGHINIGEGKGNGIVFLFGALFSVLSNFMSAIIEHALEAVIGGLVLILFRAIGDGLEVWVRGQLQKLKKLWQLIWCSKNEPPRDDDSL